MKWPYNPSFPDRGPIRDREGPEKGPAASISMMAAYLSKIAAMVAFFGPRQTRLRPLEPVGMMVVSIHAWSVPPNVSGVLRVIDRNLAFSIKIRVILPLFYFASAWPLLSGYPWQEEANPCRHVASPGRGR